MTQSASRPGLAERVSRPSEFDFFKAISDKYGNLHSSERIQSHGPSPSVLIVVSSPGFAGTGYAEGRQSIPPRTPNLGPLLPFKVQDARAQS
jgi:hypothetical protein